MVLHMLMLCASAFSVQLCVKWKYMRCDVIVKVSPFFCVRTTQPQSIELLNDPHAPYSYATEDIVWRNVFLFIWLHSAALYGIWLIGTGQVKWQTTFTGIIR